MSLPLEDCYLDHIAVAVENLDVAQKIYEDLGLKFKPERELVEEQKVLTSFAAIDQRAQLELLCPTSKDSTIQKFLDKNGPGIHHLSFRVKDIVKHQEVLTKKGYVFIYPAPKRGAHQCLVNFIHPKSCGGVLIELSQSESKI